MTETSTTSSQPSKPKNRGFLKKLLWTLLGLFLTFVVFAFAFGQYSIHRAFPQTSGPIEVEGLEGPVEVLRDSMGIPHIYADSAPDLMMAQGYVHAQDRFWQMDFWRHISTGTLSEMFGESSVEADSFLRTMGWGRLAESQVTQERPEIVDLLDAYTAGVNAYLATQSPADLSLEYSVLELLNHGYEPAPWDASDSLAWGKVMAWDLGGNMQAEIYRSLALGVLPEDRVEQLFPPYPGERHPYIVGEDMSTATGVEAFNMSSSPIQVPLRSVADAIDALNRITGGGMDTDIGSNSWVVSGAHTNTGMPLLMNDPHLAAQMPSIWYQVGLHCNNVSDACPFDVAGFSFAGVPGVVIGHNADIAWGFTNLGPDVQDLYIEKLNPENPNQYEYKGEWLDMDIRTETLKVSASADVVLEIRTTIHGPIISGVYEAIEDFDDSGIDLPAEYAIAMRWTGLDDVPSIAGPIFGLNLAEDFDDFREAARLFQIPSQNMIYADVEGNIGYQMPGDIPIRSNGDGTYPVPGWTGDYEWTGFIPFDELPTMLNPASGYIVTANNAVIDGSYPYLITQDWSYGYRARRIVDLVTSNFGIGVEDHGTLQFDAHDLNADNILPFLLSALEADASRDVDDTEVDAHNVLAAWDLQDFAGSAGAAVWNATWRHLLKQTFQDELPEDLWPWGGSQWFEVVYGLLDKPTDPFWDNVTTDTVETRDDILVSAFYAGVEEARDALGSDVARWTWGELHGMTFINQSLGESGIGFIEDRFNRGPFPASGSSSVINAVGWDAIEGFDVTWLPSMRMIVDLQDLTRSRAIHTTGQSGHAYDTHYIDMAPLWLAGETVPMLWDRSDIEADVEATLILTPLANPEF
jgi:penicillin amidase